MAKGRHSKASRQTGASLHKIANSKPHKARQKPTHEGKAHQKQIVQHPSRAQPTKQANQQAVIPFSVYDRILLVGEGDFSYAASLVEDHGVSDLLATSFDSLDDLLQKYPNTAADNINTITSAFQLDDVADDSAAALAGAPVLHSIDATRLSALKQVRSRAPFDRIIFNFPHTGGLSTDVNRQVRANQALLSAFLRACLPLLAQAPYDTSLVPPTSAGSSSNRSSNSATNITPHASILITLFDGAPYTLWNIRDLARAAGLVVERSFRFDAEAYPRYQHRRTAGVIRRRGGELAGGEESESAWKGETRLARTYEFRLGDEDGEDAAAAAGLAGAGRRDGKRKRKEESSSDED